MEIDLNDLTADLLSGPQVLANAGTSLRGRGKSAQALGAAVSRELTLVDIEQVGTAQVGVDTTPALQKLRSSHHRLAQLLAQGYKEVEASRITGYSQSRISILKNDPAFKELLSHYAKEVQDQFSDTVEKMKHVTDDALDVLHERILDEPDSLGSGVLIDLVAKIGDRAGFSPVTKSVNLNLPVDASALAALKAKVKERQNGQVNQINQEAIDATYTVVQGDHGPVVGEADGSTSPLREETESEGSAGEGVHL